MTLPLRASLLRALILGVLAALILSRSAPEGRDTRFEIDEAEWLTISIETVRQVRGEVSPLDGIPPSPYRDEAGNPWKVGIHQSTFGFMNPLLPKLVFGTVALLGGHADYDPAVYPRFAKELPAVRRERALRAVAPALPAVRRVVLVLAALTAALLFVVAERVGGWVSGILAYSLFLASPGVVDHATRIRTDFFPISLSLLALVVALGLAAARWGEKSERSRLGGALGLGVLAGLAVASKLNGALVAAMVGAWIPAVWLTRPREPRASFARGVLVPWCVAGAATVALYAAFSPHLWRAPLENLGALFDAWKGDLEHQKQRFGERLGRADTLPEHFSLASRAVAGEYEPLHSHMGLPLGIPLVLLGAAVLVLALRDARQRVTALLVLVWAGALGLGTAAWLPFGRDNFFLGLAPVVALLEGLALGAPAALLRRRTAAGNDAP